MTTPPDFYLLVDETLEVVQHHELLDSCRFESLKSFEALLDDLISRPKYKKKFDTVDELITELRKTSKNLMVVELNHSHNINELKRITYGNIIYIDAKNSLSLVGDERKERIQQEYDKIQSIVLDVKTQVKSFDFYLDFVLRKLVIKKYWWDFIYTNINQEFKEIHDALSVSPLEHVKFGYGFISGFKKKLLIDFQDYKEIYWLKMIHNPTNLELVSNSLDLKETKIFYGKSTDAIRTIDIFSDKIDELNLFRLVVAPKEMGFCTDLAPLIGLLKNYELLDKIDDNLPKQPYKSKWPR